MQKKLWKKMGIVTIILLFTTMHAHAEEPVIDDSQDITESIISAYENNRCDDVVKTYEAHKKYEYKAVTIAVVASCYKDPQLSHTLFKQAESIRPNSQVILLLHATNLWKINREASKEIWHRIKLVTREDSIRSIADDYIDGLVDETGEDKLDLFRDVSLYSLFSLGSHYSSNPEGSGISLSDTRDQSWGQMLDAKTELRKNTRWGTWGLNLNVDTQNYYSHHAGDVADFKLEGPLGYDSGNDSSVIFNPYYEHILINGVAFQSILGVGVMGYSYRPSYRQSVQALLFKDNYFDDTINSQEGTHIRFQYSWVFYPEGYEYGFGTYFEHVHASHDADPSQSASLYYSHNDWGVNGSATKKMKHFDASVVLEFSTHQDTNDSSYLVNNQLIVKRRVDYYVDIRPTVSVPVYRGIRVDSYYDYSRNFSNFGASDYQDYNSINRSAGINVNFMLDWL